MRKIGWCIAVLCIFSRAGFCEEDGGEHHTVHKHHAALFLGGTHDYHGDDAFTIGADYEYRFSEALGVGALIDYAGGDIDAIVVASGLFIHPWQDLRLLTAAGKEVHRGHSEFLIRLGAMYDFHIEGWSVSPTFHVDLIEGGHQNLIYGIALGRGF